MVDNGNINIFHLICLAGFWPTKEIVSVVLFSRKKTKKTIWKIYLRDSLFMSDFAFDNILMGNILIAFRSFAQKNVPVT